MTMPWHEIVVAALASTVYSSPTPSTVSRRPLTLMVLPCTAVRPTVP